jgi:HSP20 family protein
MSNALSVIRRNPVNVSAYNRFPSLLGGSIFDDFFNDFFQDMGALQRKTVSGYPVADIFTNEDGSTVMEFALAGFSKEDLTVDVKPEKHSITVSANVAEGEDNNRRIARRAFTKTYVNYDNNLDLASSSASFENGLLTITVPRKAEVQPVSIEIS